MIVQTPITKDVNCPMCKTKFVREIIDEKDLDKRNNQRPSFLICGCCMVLLVWKDGVINHPSFGDFRAVRVDPHNPLAVGSFYHKMLDYYFAQKEKFVATLN